LDLSKYFESIDHAILRERWCEVLDVPRLPTDHFAIFRSLTRYASVDRRWLHQHFNVPREAKRGGAPICSPSDFRTKVRAWRKIEVNRKVAGIPQGSPISAMLSNIYLLEFDARMTAVATRAGGFYRRYCDDILIVIGPEPLQRALVEQELAHVIAEHKVTENKKKRDVVEFTVKGGRLVADHAMQYLGFTFDGRNTRVRGSSISRYYRRMHKAAWRCLLGASRSKADRRVFKRQMYDRYSHLGSRNFVTYVFRASQTMGQRAIRAQVRNHWGRLVGLVSRPVPEP
jgi:hypothetical protein